MGVTLFPLPGPAYGTHLPAARTCLLLHPLGSLQPREEPGWGWRHCTQDPAKPGLPNASPPPGLAPPEGSQVAFPLLPADCMPPAPRPSPHLLPGPGPEASSAAAASQGPARPLRPGARRRVRPGARARGERGGARLQHALSRGRGSVAWGVAYGDSRITTPPARSRTRAFLPARPAGSGGVVSSCLGRGLGGPLVTTPPVSGRATPPALARALSP